MKNDFHGGSSIGSSSLSRLPQTRTGLFTCIACLLILLCYWTSNAQSGRRTPKSLPTPSATPEPTPGEMKPKAEKPALNLVVGIDQRDAFASVPTYFYDTVLQGCADRLRDASSVKVDVAGRQMNRAEAIQQAKAGKEAFVVLLELKTDNSYSGLPSNTNYDELYVEYVAFAPETAKVAASGRAYQRAYQNRGVIVGPRTTGRNNSVVTEQLLRQAARDAADRILKALHVSLPRDQ